MRNLSTLFVAFLAGCSCSPQTLVPPEPVLEPWDLSYLVDLDPSAVTDSELDAAATAAREHYIDRCQSLGVIYSPRRSAPGVVVPDQFGTGGDSALFTGYALAGFSLQYHDSLDPVTLQRAKEALGAVWWLTHAAGPGVIARQVFPLSTKEKWSYPTSSGWQKRIASGFVDESPTLTAPNGMSYPAGAYYTRATKDQLTGLLFGLANAWAYLPSERPMIASIVHDLREQLTKHNWKIRDQHGKNDTSADTVSGHLRLQFAALYRHTVSVSSSDPNRIKKALDDYIDRLVPSLGDLFNKFTNYQQYYAHNLRAARAFTVWLLEPDPEIKQKIANYYLNNVWKHVKHHQNAFFASITYAMGDPAVRSIAIDALKSLSLRPDRAWGSPYAGQTYGPQVGDVVKGCDKLWVLAPHLRKKTNYWTWTKAPWDVGSGIDKNGTQDNIRLDLFLPYALVKAFD